MDKNGEINALLEIYEALLNIFLFVNKHREKINLFCKPFHEQCKNRIMSNKKPFHE